MKAYEWQQQPRQQQAETEQMAAIADAKARAQSGIWVAFYDDRSGLAIFESELKALRYAVLHNMEVRPVAFGEDVWGAVR